MAFDLQPKGYRTPQGSLLGLQLLPPHIGYEAESSSKLQVEQKEPDLASAYLARLAPGSRRTQACALRWLADALEPGADPRRLPWWKLTPEATLALHARLRSSQAPATARRHVAALRGVLREAWRQGLLDSDRRDRLSDLPAIRATRLAAGRALEPAELEAMREAGDARDRAVLAVLSAGGLRRDEAATLENVDTYAEVPTLVRLVVLGKGDKERIIYLAGRAADDVAACPPPWRLPSGAAVWRLVRRVARAAGVKHVSPHDLRRTFTSRSLAAGVDLATVQRAMGHSDPRTTARYDRRSEQALIDAAKALA